MLFTGAQALVLKSLAALYLKILSDGVYCCKVRSLCANPIVVYIYG